MTDNGSRRRGFVAEILTLLLLGSFAVGITLVSGSSKEAGSEEAIAEAEAPIVASHPAPTPAPVPAPVEATDPADEDEEGPKRTSIDAVPQETRRQAYAAQQIAESNADALATSMYPEKLAPADAAGKVLFKAARDGRYDELRLAARKTVARRYEISRAQLDAIRKEGDTQHWSVAEINGEMSSAETHAMALPQGSSDNRRGGGGHRSGNAGRSSRH